MRLLRCDGEEPALLTFHDDKQIPKYAILSHTWMAAEDEVVFTDLNDFRAARQKPGWFKLDYACKQARKNNLTYIWIDTCCIDKSSSAELAEAINSMYRWYKEAAVCYVYLADVLNTVQLDKEGLTTADEGDWSEIMMSRWFTRGWTLQELLAPLVLVFFNADWVILGTLTREVRYDRYDMRDPDSETKEPARMIANITGIHEDALLGPFSPDNFSIAQRMCWAADRKTTRAEDRAYSLLGIFDINLPIIYGEGHKAFVRLQQEILQASTDQSIFAWDHLDENDVGCDSAVECLLAPSPMFFRDAGNVIPLAFRRTRVYQVTPIGVRFNSPVVPSGYGNIRHLVLHCTLKDDDTRSVILSLESDSGVDEKEEEEVFLPSARRTMYLDVYHTMLTSTEKTTEVLHRARSREVSLPPFGETILIRCEDDRSLSRAQGLDLSTEALEPLNSLSCWHSESQSFKLLTYRSFQAELCLLFGGEPRIKVLLQLSDDIGAPFAGNASIRFATVDSTHGTVQNTSMSSTPNRRPLEAQVILDDGSHVSAEMFEQLLNERWMTVVAIRVTDSRSAASLPTEGFEACDERPGNDRSRKRIAQH